MLITGALNEMGALNVNRIWRRKMTKIIRFRIFRPVLAAMLLAAILFATGSPQLSAEDALAPNSSAGEAVRVTEAKKACFDDITEITGVLVPKEEVLVRPDREGLRISEVLVEAGASVKEGQALARLVSPDSQRGSGNQVPVQAPVAGIIGKSHAVVGARASAMAEPLFQIIANGELELLAQTSAKRLSKLSSGYPATIRVVGAGELPGRTRLVSAAVDAATQLGEVRVSINFDERLKAGMFARAFVNSGQRCDNVAVPLSALLYGQEGTIVQVVRGGRIESRIVSTGLQSGGNIEIHQGIADGDLVVARAGAFLRDGDQVKPVLAEGSGSVK